ncbi:precorrin-3B C(17)-methyltransferase [Thermogymnomonas acidicola]|nr:precorrin-3B C(17)-methyltransferase [Thermogymnomonas acidicola]
MTLEAVRCIEESEVIVGYHLYLRLIEGMLAGKTVISAGMTEEIGRVRAALEMAEAGYTVSLVSSGDPGIYGLAGLVFQVAGDSNLEIRVVPGVSALSSCSAVLGAPLMNDFVCISLSDMLTPMEKIEERIEAAARADFVVVVYNPKGSRFEHNLERFREIMLRHRPPDTPVGIVRKAYREGEERVITTLADMLSHRIDMVTTIIVGNSNTFVSGGRMVTPRGYENKYRIERA